MRYLFNFIYLFLLFFAAPWLVYKAITTGKYRKGMWRKIWGLTPVRDGDNPCVWFHAVSVGEVLLLRQVVAKFRQRHPDWEVVISTTTNTGFDVAVATFPGLSVFYWPFDFTWAVNRALRRIRPSLAVLAELELWPNFLALAKRFGCPVAVINGRMSHRSHRGYRRIRPITRRMLLRVDCFAVQNGEYHDRLLDLGANPNRLFVTGSVKYDGVSGDPSNPKTQELARLLFPPSERSEQLVWLAGSTQEPEEQIVLDIYRKAKSLHPGLRLILVPRHKERFDEVAKLLADGGLPYVRRSQLEPRNNEANPESIILIDTLGELGAAWGLADVAFVGGSLGQRGGQNMIEPAAYGAAVTFGPNTWNFKETVERLLECQAAIQVKDANELEQTILRLLADGDERRRLGDAARAFVQSQQGATERTIDLLDAIIGKAGQSACTIAA